MFTFIKDKISRLSSLIKERQGGSLHFALVVFLTARFALSVWAFAISALIPLVVSNFDLHGEPVVTAFDMRTSTRAVFSRMLNGMELHFRAAYPNLTDAETYSVWDLNGRAVSGEHAGAQLHTSTYSVEDVFPYRGVTPTQNMFLAPWQRFDANWYLEIVERGYSDDGNTVYFPLYPLLITVIGNWLLRDGMLGAILISNFALIGALYLFHQLALELNIASAKSAVALFMIFPTAFFLLAPYTESLFLFCALACLRGAQHGRWGRAGVWGALAALTRLQGVLLLAPLAWLYWKQTIAGRNSQNTLPIRDHLLRLLPLLFIPLSTIAFFSFTNLSLLTTYQSQLHARFVMPWENVWEAVARITQARASMIDMLNLIATILFGGLIALVWIQLPRDLGWYSIAMYLAPLFRMTSEQPLVSMVRYVSIIFPVFILFAQWGTNVWVRRTIVYLSIPFQLVLSAQFILWGWVG